MNDPVKNQAVQAISQMGPSPETRALRHALAARDAYSNRCIDLTVDNEILREQLGARDNEIHQLGERLAALEESIKAIETKEAANGSTLDPGQQAGPEQSGLRPLGEPPKLDADAWSRIVNGAALGHAGDGPTGASEGPG